MSGLIQFFRRLTLQQRISFVLVGAVALWVLSSYVITPSRTTHGDKKTASNIDVSSLLQVTPLQAKEKTRRVIVYGATEPNRTVELKAETQGAVVKIPVKEGSEVKKGTVIVNIDERDRRARYAQAKAILNQRQIEYKAAQRLQKSGFQTEVRLAETQANLERAKAELVAINLELRLTKLKAPFDGILEKINVELGDFVGVGVFGGEGALATLVDVDPLLISAQISENDRQSIAVGAKAMIRLVDGTEHEGRISYVANVSQGDSRTFRVEVEIPNEGSRLAAGMSAQMYLNAGNKKAYFLSPSVLSLNDEGDIGVKAISDNGNVIFHKAQLLEDTKDGVWLSGLPDALNIITLGHAFVSAGQQLDSNVVHSLLYDDHDAVVTQGSPKNSPEIVEPTIQKPDEFGG